MTIPATYQLEWVRGTTTPFVFAMKRNGVPIPFDDVRLSVYKRGGSTLIWRATYTDGGGITVLDAGNGLLKFQPSAEQTRQLIKSKDGVTPQNNYELEYWYQGSQEVYLMGDILAIGGINDDEVDPS